MADRKIIFTAGVPSANQEQRSITVIVTGVLLAGNAPQLVVVVTGGGHQPDDEGRPALVGEIRS